VEKIIAKSHPEFNPLRTASGGFIRTKHPIGGSAENGPRKAIMVTVHRR
jgi:hypothetical protein